MTPVCGWCEHEVAEGVRYCTRCGHKIQSEETSSEPTALTDLKDCFGSFPYSEVHCYVCADQEKCADLALSKQLLSLHQDLASLNAELKAIRQATADVEDGLAAVHRAIDSGFQRTCSALNAINSSINRSTTPGIR